MATALHTYLALATVALQLACLPAAITLSSCQLSQGEYSWNPEEQRGFVQLDIAGMSKSQCRHLSGNLLATRGALLAAFGATPAGRLVHDVAGGAGVRLRSRVSIVQCIECRASEQAANAYEARVVFFVRAGARGRRTMFVVPARQLVDELQHLDGGVVAARLAAPDALLQFSPHPDAVVEETAAAAAISPPPCPPRRPRGNSTAQPTEDEDMAEEEGGSGCGGDGDIAGDDVAAAGDELVRNTRKRNTHVPARHRCRESLGAMLRRWYRCYGLHGTSADCRAPTHEELCPQGGGAEAAAGPAAQPVASSRRPARGSRGLSDRDVLFPADVVEMNADLGKATGDGSSVVTPMLAVLAALLLAALTLGLVALRLRRRTESAEDDDIIVLV